MPPSIQAQLADLNALAARLNATFSDPAAGCKWLASACGSLGGIPPHDALLQGRIAAVTGMIIALDTGVFV